MLLIQRNTALRSIKLFSAISLSSIILSLLSTKSLAAVNSCTAIFSAKEQQKNVDKKVDEIDWWNDVSYIETLQRSEALGLVRSEYSEKWQTQVFYANNGTPNHKGQLPLVDRNSKGVFILFHGSGTSKSSGKNFSGNMNTLAKLGYSSIAVDMPFHNNGPRDEKFKNAFYFMEWVKQIVLEAKKYNLPIYLAGHSFGPDVILEFAARYPKLIDGVVALSPAAFNKELQKWYENYTTKMKFGGDVPANDEGGHWAWLVSQQFLWSKGRLADPTVVNKNLKIRILSGDREEYVEAPLHPETLLPIGQNTYDISVPLLRLLKNSVVTIEPGIGHYLFDHLDATGINVVTRELLLVAGEDPKRIKAISDGLRNDLLLLQPAVQLQKRYAQDDLFRAWADKVFGKGKVLSIARYSTDNHVQKVLAEYENAKKAREFELYQKILLEKEKNSDFYLRFKNLIDGFNPKKVDTTLFYPYLAMVLKAE